LNTGVNVTSPARGIADFRRRKISSAARRYHKNHGNDPEAFFHIHSPLIIGYANDVPIQFRYFLSVFMSAPCFQSPDSHDIWDEKDGPVQEFDFALGWNRRNTQEVSAAFNVNYLKREIGKIQVNKPLAKAKVC
jgi:hypothetical protein